MVKATFEFYEKNIIGTFNVEPSIYEATGERKEDIDIRDVLWQAIEIERFDESEIYVTIDFEEDGLYLDREEATITADVVRTEEPSEYVLWFDKKPTIFKIDREKSKLYIEE